jgi:hypothetical protein
VLVTQVRREGFQSFDGGAGSVQVHALKVHKFSLAPTFSKPARTTTKTIQTLHFPLGF